MCIWVVKFKSLFPLLFFLKFIFEKKIKKKFYTFELFLDPTQA